MPRVLRGRDIVCVGSAGWRADPWTEEHHLAARLGHDNRVLYLEPPAHDPARLSGRLGNGLGRRQPDDGVQVLTPPALPGRAGRALRARIVRSAVRRRGFERIVLWGFVPEAEELLDPLAPDQVVYHCRRAWPPSEAERRLAARADLVLAPAPALLDRLRALGTSPCYAPAVADTAAFARALADGPVDRALAALPHPRVVVTGAVSPRAVDVELVAALARLRPAWQLALVGPVPAREQGALGPLRDVPNVHLLGSRPHAAMPEVLRGADAALVPARVGPETATLFPMRLYEHLAAGLPVVATPLPALAALDPGEVVLADGPEAVAAALDDLLDHDDLEARRARSASAARHSWDARLQEIATALRRPA